MAPLAGEVAEFRDDLRSPDPEARREACKKVRPYPPHSAWALASLLRVECMRLKLRPNKNESAKAGGSLAVRERVWVPPQ